VSKDYIVTATVKGQVVIPVALRRRLGIHEGTRLRLRVEDGVIVIQPLTEEYLRRLRGSLPGKGALETLMKDRSAERDR
jgi:AbrB family looped-hinge helix DNA binding protein